MPTENNKQAEHWGGPDMFSFLMQLDVMFGSSRSNRHRE